MSEPSTDELPILRGGELVSPTLAREEERDNEAREEPPWSWLPNHRAHDESRRPR